MPLAFNPADFATAVMPLRSSKLSQFVRCPWSAIMTMLKEREEAGKAADTGSAVHMAARAYHTVAEKDTRTAIGVMRAGFNAYPFADLEAAENQFRCYAADPRNIQAEVLLCEAKIEVTLPPAEDDPTQKEILIQGTLDQVRREGSRLSVCDIKTGSAHEGPDMLAEHCLQLCAYQLGASALLKTPVHGAKVIRTKDYLKRSPGPVFWEGAWRFSDIGRILDCVRFAVSRVRRGGIAVNPTADACRWCIGLPNCIPELKELKLNA